MALPPAYQKAKEQKEKQIAYTNKRLGRTSSTSSGGSSRSSSSSSNNSQLQQAESRLKALKEGTTAYELQVREIAKLKGSSYEKYLSENPNLKNKVRNKSSSAMRNNVSTAIKPEEPVYYEENNVNQQSRQLTKEEVKKLQAQQQAQGVSTAFVNEQSRPKTYNATTIYKRQGQETKVVGEASYVQKKPQVMKREVDRVVGRRYAGDSQRKEFGTLRVGESEKPSKFQKFISPTVELVESSVIGSAKIYREASNNPANYLANPSLLGVKAQMSFADRYLNNFEQATTKTSTFDKDVVTAGLLSTGVGVASTGVIGSFAVRSSVAPMIGYSGAKAIDKNTPGAWGEFALYSSGEVIPLARKGPRVTTENVGGRRVVGVDYGTRGKGKSILSFGKVQETPDLIQPKTGAGTDYFVKNIGKYITKDSKMLVEGKEIPVELQQRFAIESIKTSRELAKTKSKFFTADDLTSQGTKTMTEKEAGAVFKSIGEQKGRVFGSFATRPQLKSELKRPVGDIEAYWETSNEGLLKSITENTLKDVQAVGKGKYRIDPESPFHIEKRIGNQWEKIVEFKGKGIGEGDSAPENAFGYKLFSESDIAPMQGTKTALLRGELKRKLAGSVMLKEGKLEVAHTGRFKDVGDYFRIAESLGESRGLQKSPSTRRLLGMQQELGIDTSQPVKVELTPSGKYQGSSMPSYRMPGQFMANNNSPLLTKSPRASSTISPGTPSTSISPSSSIWVSTSASPSQSVSISSVSPSSSLILSPNSSISPRASSTISPGTPSTSISPSSSIWVSTSASPSQSVSISSVSPSSSPSPSISPRASPNPQFIPSPFSPNSKKKKKDEEYLVFTRKFGRDTLVGRYKTQRLATFNLKRNLETSARASGYIESKGQKNYVDLGQGFRRSLIDKFRVVQKRENRISTIGEKKDITYKGIAMRRRGINRFLK